MLEMDDDSGHRESRKHLTRCPLPVDGVSFLRSMVSEEDTVYTDEKRILSMKGIGAWY